MVALETFLSECTGLLLGLSGELNDGRKQLKFLVEQAVGFETEQLSMIGETWCWPSKVKPKVVECTKRLKAERNRAEDELTMKKERFIEELDEYVRQAEAFAGTRERPHARVALAASRAHSFTSPCALSLSLAASRAHSFTSPCALSLSLAASRALSLSHEPPALSLAAPPRSLSLSRAPALSLALTSPRALSRSR